MNVEREDIQAISVDQRPNIQIRTLMNHLIRLMVDDHDEDQTYLIFYHKPLIL